MLRKLTINAITLHCQEIVRNNSEKKLRDIILRILEGKTDQFQSFTMTTDIVLTDGQNVGIKYEMEHLGRNARTTKLELRAMLEHSDGSTSKEVVLKCAEICDMGSARGVMKLESVKAGQYKVSRTKLKYSDEDFLQIKINGELREI